MGDYEEKCPLCGVDQKGIVKAEEEVKPARLNVLCVLGFAFALMIAVVFAFFAVEIALADNLGVLALVVVGIFAYGVAGVLGFGFSLDGLIWAVKAKHRGKGFAIAATLIILIILSIISNLKLQ